MPAIASGAFLAIAHFGDAPASGRAAKLIIDIMAAVGSLASASALIKSPCYRRDRLSAIVSDVFVMIAHIDGTAISRLAAKLVIDIMAAVDSLADVGALIERLCDNGCTTSTASMFR